MLGNFDLKMKLNLIFILFLIILVNFNKCSCVPVDNDGKTNDEGELNFEEPSDTGEPNDQEDPDSQIKTVRMMETEQPVGNDRSYEGQNEQRIPVTSNKRDNKMICLGKKSCLSRNKCGLLGGREFMPGNNNCANQASEKYKNQICCAFNDIYENEQDLNESTDKESLDKQGTDSPKGKHVSMRPMELAAKTQTALVITETATIRPNEIISTTPLTSTSTKKTNKNIFGQTYMPSGVTEWTDKLKWKEGNATDCEKEKGECFYREITPWREEMGPAGKVKIRTNTRYLLCDARHLQCLTKAACDVAGGERLFECKTCKGEKKWKVEHGYERKDGYDYCHAVEKFYEETIPRFWYDANHHGKHLNLICCQAVPIDNAYHLTTEKSTVPFTKRWYNYAKQCYSSDKNCN